MRHFNALRWWTRWSRKRALALCADSWRWQPDLGHEVPAGELGQHVSVDYVGLGGQGCDAFGLDRVGDRHLPAGELELIVDEA